MSMMLMERAVEPKMDDAIAIPDKQVALKVTPESYVSVHEVTQLFQPVLLEDWIRPCPVLAPEQSCGTLVDLFRHRKDLECVAVCDEAGQPLGLIMKHRFFRSLSTLYGMSLYADKPVTKLMDEKALVAETTLSPQLLIDQAMARGEETVYDTVLLKRDGKFAGVVTISDLLNISRMLQRELASRQIVTVRGTEKMMNDIHEVVDRLADSSAHSRKTSLEIADMTDHGRVDLAQMLALFRLWTQTAERQEHSVGELLNRAKDTLSITRMISELADQCNLLAINAQIEAARAGEHGRGFAVVAQEVRSLADQTKRQAEQINRQLKGMAEAAGEAAAHVREGKTGADQGIRQVQKTEDTFARLWQSSSDNLQATERLTVASKDAHATSEQIRLQMRKLASQMNPAAH